MQNRQLAAFSGIAHRRRPPTFFIGSGLAGVAGVGVTLLGPVGPTLGTQLHRRRVPRRRRRRPRPAARGGLRRARARHASNSFIEYWTRRQRGQGGRVRAHRAVPAVRARRACSSLRRGRCMSVDARRCPEPAAMPPRPSARAARSVALVAASAAWSSLAAAGRAGAPVDFRLACWPSTCASRSSPSASTWPGATAAC